jgi:hypothetical protein
MRPFTRDQIVEMARECGILMRSHETQVEPTKLERFAALVAAHEREACAKACDELADEVRWPDRNAYDCATAIRARGERP